MKIPNLEILIFWKISNNFKVDRNWLINKPSKIYGSKEVLPRIKYLINK